MEASVAGNHIEVEINTRLVSYSIPFYASLLMASDLRNGFYKFCVGLFCLWVVMAFGLASIAAKAFGDGGGPFLSARCAACNLLALAYNLTSY